MLPEMYVRRFPARPHSYGIGSGVLLVLLSACAAGGSSYGLNKLTGLPFIIGLLLVVLLRATSMYFLRYQSPYERFINGGWDRNLAYVLTTFFSVLLAAFGLYCLSGSRAEDGFFAPPNAAGQTVQPFITSSSSPVEGADNNATSGKTNGAGDVVSAAPLGKFLNDTLVEQTTIAMGCWIVPLVIELFILLLVLYHRPRYLPYDFME